MEKNSSTDPHEGLINTHQANKELRRGIDRLQLPCEITLVDETI